jgi:hypothetical protein
MNINYPWSDTGLQSIYILSYDVLCNVINFYNNCWCRGHVKIILDHLKPENKWKVSSCIERTAIESQDLCILSSILS